MINSKFSITTGTSTLSIFDLESLKHRMEDSPDWWSISKDEIDEINKGNVIFLNLGEDGAYNVELCSTLEEDFMSLFINVPSGSVFIGAGEDTTGGNLEPDSSEYISGKILDIPIGKYEIRFNKLGRNIKIMFLKSQKNTSNLSDLVRI